MQWFRGRRQFWVVIDVVRGQRHRSGGSWTVSAATRMKTSSTYFLPWRLVRNVELRSMNQHLLKRSLPEECCLYRPWSSVSSGGLTCRRSVHGGGAIHHHRLPGNPSCLRTGESVRRLRGDGGPTSYRGRASPPYTSQLRTCNGSSAGLPGVHNPAFC